MKKLWDNSYYIILLFFAWRLVLSGISYMAPSLWALHVGFLGPLHWANFDGVHYLGIAREGYRQYLQAFFPLYPLLISKIAFLLSHIDPIYIALMISHGSFFVGLLLFYKLIELEDPSVSYWPLIFLLFFPTSFFFASVYTTSLFFLFAVGTVYAAKKKRYILAGLLGGLASATQIFGVFLCVFLIREYMREHSVSLRKIALLGAFLVPTGLILYMVYLTFSVHDPLAFFHVQPVFGAHRTGNGIVLLPQVLWRYVRIISTVQYGSFPWIIAVFELSSFLFGFLIVYVGWRRGIDWSYLIYCLAILILPTLTGTLSSLPRYLLSAFPLLYILATLLHDKRRYGFAAISFVLLVLFGSAFLQGYFVS